MDWLEFEERIRKDESLHTEFKQAPVRPDDLAAELVAFANTDGGSAAAGVRRNLFQMNANIIYSNSSNSSRVISQSRRILDIKPGPIVSPR